MIRRAEERKVDHNEKMREGTGTVKVNHLLSKEEFEGAGRLFSELHIQPGDSIGYHIHENEQEFFYILSGEGLYNDNGTEVVVKAGDVAICKDGEYQGIKAVGNEPLVFIGLITYTK